MTPRGTRLVQESWERLQGREEGVAAGFYARLFTLEPELRHLFVLSDMEGLREKLVATVDLILGRLAEPCRLADQVASC